jgi:3-hydroxyisobutyrate dehydrogenase
MTIAFLGTGLIGKPMAEKLIKSGYEMIVYNRTVEKTKSLKESGASVAKNPKDAIESADGSILMLSDAQAIREVLFSDQIDFRNKTIIQMGTILPAESQNFHEKINSAGGDYFEAPVLGSIPQVQEGKLIAMVGGNQDQYNKWKEVFKSFGEDIHYVGSIGKAAALKLAMNQLIASLTAAFSLSLSMIQRNNIDVDLFMKIVRNSALYAPTFDKKLPRMLKRDFSNPNFPTKHLLKDADLIFKESKRLGLSTYSLEGVIHLIKISLEKGFVETDYSSIYNEVNPQD